MRLFARKRRTCPRRSSSPPTPASSRSRSAATRGRGTTRSGSAAPARPPTLTIPPRGSLTGARRFLDRHSSWLKRQVARVPAPTEIADGGVGPVPRPRRTSSATSRIVAGPASRTTGPGGCWRYRASRTHLRRRVIDYLKREARRDLEAAVIRHAAALGVRPKVMRLRDQRSRWGSCSGCGHLSFSWRLIMAPPFVLDYLAAHEVAHLPEHNHSRRFWRLVEKLCPDWRGARAWLRAEGSTLHAVDAG